jgi:hypothetical protein
MAVAMASQNSVTGETTFEVPTVSIVALAVTARSLRDTSPGTRPAEVLGVCHRSAGHPIARLLSTAPRMMLRSNSANA